MNNLLEMKGEQDQLAKEHAVLEVGTILDKCSIRGANDSEIIELNKIIESIKSGDKAPHEGVEEAKRIEAAKMDYR